MAKVNKLVSKIDTIKADSEKHGKHGKSKKEKREKKTKASKHAQVSASAEANSLV